MLAPLSPKLHDHEEGLFVEESVKVTVRGAGPEKGEALNSATGGCCVSPVPLREMSRVGVSGSLEGTERVAVFVPPDWGMNLMSRVQVPEGSRVWPEQASFSLKN